MDVCISSFDADAPVTPTGRACRHNMPSLFKYKVFSNMLNLVIKLTNCRLCHL